MMTVISTGKSLPAIDTHFVDGQADNEWDVILPQVERLCGPALVTSVASPRHHPGPQSDAAIEVVARGPRAR